MIASSETQGLGGWRANSNVENSDGGISDEYSDDDDPGLALSRRNMGPCKFISTLCYLLAYIQSNSI